MMYFVQYADRFFSASDNGAMRGVVECFARQPLNYRSSTCQPEPRPPKTKNSVKHV
jgi:hypothetical protein